jgi:N-acetylglucosamine-6-phosphate deacetylase
MSSATQFINCHQCINGNLISKPLTINSSGQIIPNSPLPAHTQIVDLKGSIISPGFIELQINGALGFHFAHFSNATVYQENERKLARYLPKTGVTGFYPTVPTVSAKVLREVLPFLGPSELVGAASVLGAHVEGPFLSPSKKGAHDETLLQLPRPESLEAVYGRDNLVNSVRLLTLAPELPGALSRIKTLTKEYNIRVSMGHSNASFEEAKAGLEAGANLITHTFNAMKPLHHREPGLVGKKRRTSIVCPTAVADNSRSDLGIIPAIFFSYS